MPLRVFDNHFHLNQNHDFLQGVIRFKKAGGSSLNLTNLPDYSIPMEHYYDTIYSNTLKMAAKIRKEEDLDVVVTLGPYPLDIMHFLECDSNAIEFVKDGINKAKTLIERGDANAMGEIGRPHFPVPQNIVDLSNDLLQYAFELCSDIGCPAILHTEDFKEESILDLVNMCKKTGMQEDMVVKHHALPENLKSSSPVIFSIPATRRFTREAIQNSNSFLLETDFVDDINDINRFLPPESVPLRAIMITQQYPDSCEEILKNIFYKIPDHLFGSDSFKL
jgi:TatD-related deoxyribonuclease